MAGDPAISPEGGPLNASYLSGLWYFVITYDIACKYGTNFKKRCFNEDPDSALIPTPNGEMFVAFCVNKFHQESHEESCSANNALNYTKYVGRTIRTGYLKGLEAYAGVTERLEDLKMSLGRENVAELEKRYKSSGGEQFLEDREGLNWLSRNELLATMREVEGPANRGTSTVAQHNVSYVDFISKALQLEEMQAKLRQRAHDIARLGSNASPRMKSQMANLHKRLEGRLQQHYEKLSEIVPQLSQAGHQICPDAPQNDEILLPSRLNDEEIEHLGLGSLLQVEMQLRVGHAYEAIASLKKALSMRSFWTRHVKAQYVSQARRTKGQTSLQSCQARVKEASRAYTTCYNWLVKCAPEIAQDFGLQQLRNQDLMLLSEYLEQQHYRYNGQKLSWIWTLKPKVLATDDVDDEESPPS
ncbi:hypothetical protein FRC00_009770, partial [Tulasnella sp. 408]